MSLEILLFHVFKMVLEAIKSNFLFVAPEIQKSFQVIIIFAGLAQRRSGKDAGIRKLKDSENTNFILH